MFKLYRLITLVSIFFISSNSYAQKSSIDSLEILLKNPKLHDTTRLSIMSEIIGSSKIGDTTIGHYNKSIKQILDKRVKEKNLSKKELEAYKYSLAIWYCDKSAEISSKKNAKLIISYYDKAIAIFKELKLEDETWFAVNNKGYALRKLNMHQEAIECFFTALKHHEKQGNKQGVAYAQTAIAHVYEDQNQFAKSIANYNNALLYYNSLKKIDPQKLYEKQVILGNIGNNYYNLNQFEKAKKYIIEKIKINEDIGNEGSNGYALRTLGDIEYKLYNRNDAIKFYKKGLLHAEDEAAKTGLLYGLGKTYLELNNIVDAKKYLIDAKSNAETIKDLETLKWIYKKLYIIYKNEKEYKPALEMFEKFQNAKDSTNLQSSRDALLKQQLKYDFEKKELNLKLNAEKKNAIKNNWLIALSGTLLLSLLGGYFYYRNNKQKQAIAFLEKNQIKQKLLITQMNPHFIFNSIDNIQGLIYNKQDTDAINYLSKFSKLTRQILENSNENYISLSEEVEMIENYIALQQLLYNNKFDYTISVENTIETDTFLLPPMLTQPFIENAIKHGLNTITTKGLINISFYLKDTKLFFEVLDNGKGFDLKKEAPNHKSLAMTITKERLVYYTKNQDFEMKTNNIMDQDKNVVGAQVVFEIPYIYEK